MPSIQDFLSSAVPASFKDARMTLESVLGTSVLPEGAALTCAYAVAVSLSSARLAGVLKEHLSEAQAEQAEVAAAIMGMTNVYYSFLDTAKLPGVAGLPAQLRMVTYGQQGAKDKLGFETAALAVSIAGKCKPCIVSHVEELKKLSFSDEQFRDLARLVSAVNAVSKVI